MDKDRRSLWGMTQTELKEELIQLGFEGWRGSQISSWLSHPGVDFDTMQNLPKSLREKLKESFLLDLPQISAHEFALDGTEKIALTLKDHEVIEMVFIPTEDRGTLCISSQVGCAAKCAFCFTGTQGFTRNLTADEIVGQVLVMRNLLQDKGQKNQKRTLTNIVVMGMGEPLHNYPEVSKALKILMDEKGLAFSKRRMTLSTSGVVPRIVQCGNELGVNLAVSLHASNNKIRNQIMPINHQYPIEQLIEACRQYPGLNTARRMTFEYVMLNGINDHDEHARELVHLVKGIPAKFNLIPWNPWAGAPFQTSLPQRIQSFASILLQNGCMAFVRTPRGQDISAACGQLKTKFTNENSDKILGTAE